MSSDGPVNSTAPPATAPQTSDPPMKWDGDGMFNIYIYDYCLKRGFHKTAQELCLEAQLPSKALPPIDAKQGLLFEWWSVFWVLFAAKSRGDGSPDALLYTEHQQQMQNEKQQRTVAQQGQQQQRFANGVRPPNLPVPQTNGVGPAATQTGPLPNSTQNPVPFPSGAPQPNGVPGSSTGPPGMSGPPQGQGMPQGHPNQRAVPPQQRGMNGASFQSPTMAHSPPNPPGPPQPPNAMGSMGPVGANQPLTQMNRGGMHPPNGPQIPMGQQQSAFQQLVGRSPSNPGSPAQNNLVQQSPGLTNRQPPGLNQPSIEMELNRIPPPTLQKIKQDLNMGDKDVNVMTIEEKQQLVTHFRRSTMKPPGAGPIQPGQQGPMSHPSGLRNAQLLSNAQQPLPPPQGQGPNQQQRGAKRNSTSPGQEPQQLPRNDSSPPANKRPRTSPTGADQAPQQPPMAPMYPHPPQAGGPSMQPPMPPNGGMMRQMQMPFAGQPMTNPMLGHGLGTPQMSPMNPPMNPGMMGVPQGGMVNNPQQMHQYRQAMQTIHKPPHLHMMPGGVPSPSASDPQGGGMPGGPLPGNRMGQLKPMTGMMPPPSPAMAAKTPGGPSKPEDNIAPNASPQNAATGIGGQMSGQNPSAAGPTQVSTPAPPTPNASGMTASSPSAILNASTPNMASSHPPPPPPPTTDGLDPTSFAGIDFVDFDTNLFNGDSSLNFERDFAAWFDPENAT